MYTLLHGFRVVIQLDITLGAVEQCWRNRQISGLGKSIGDGPDVGVDAKNFLQYDDSRLGLAGGLGNVCVELVAIRGLQLCMLCHFFLQ